MARPHSDPEIVKAFAAVERDVARLRRLLALDPGAPMRANRKLRLREAGLRSLTDDWMTMAEWQTAVLALGYRPASDTKRPDQFAKSLAVLAHRNGHLVEATGTGSYRRRPDSDDAWETQ